MKFVHPHPCFSGTCGLCLNCCGNYQTQRNNPPSNERGTDLLKFHKSASDGETMANTYWNRLNTLKTANYFTKPSEDSLLCKRFSIERQYNGETYLGGKRTLTLLKQNDGKRCMAPSCQILYEDTHEFQKNRLFADIPLYSDKHCVLCALCVRESGEPLKNF